MEPANHFDLNGEFHVEVSVTLLTRLEQFKFEACAESFLGDIHQQVRHLGAVWKPAQKIAEGRLNIAQLRAQLSDIQATFGDLLRRLPNRTEVPDLLVDITKEGLGAGLEFELFKPGQERNADFYMELPIQIKVIGGFHDFGSFVSGISDLPRIVTTHNIDISEQDGGVLSMNMTAKTYRYVDEEG